MTAMLVLAAVHLLVPAAFIAWQWRGAVSSRVQWLTRSAAFAGFLLALHYAGFWGLRPLPCLGIAHRQGRRRQWNFRFGAGLSRLPAAAPPGC
jgi:hypothetical protein